jgi:hypothetical protein
MIPQIRNLHTTDLSKNASNAFLYTADLTQRHDGEMVTLPAMKSLPSIVRFYGSLNEESKFFQYEKKVDTKLIEKRLQVS